MALIAIIFFRFNPLPLTDPSINNDEQKSADAIT